MRTLMMNICRYAALSLIFTSVSAVTQTPIGATGKCKDGTYSTATKKAGACSGHKGVDTWFAAQANQSGAEAVAAPRANPTAVPETSAKTPSSTPAAPAAAARPQAQGAGPGMVWVNTSSKVYHCPGSKYYGTTKQGKYLSESDAVAMGARPDHGKACSK